MAGKLKIMTVVGTRPEIIRLSSTMKLLDRHTVQTVVHTGQNYDYELNEIFFKDLGLRKPDEFLNVGTASLGSTLGNVLTGIERAISSREPDAFVVLGDTNSSVSSIIAKRMHIPVFHLEAGNRSFDENVPEETNRKIVDHIADYNLVYTEHARRNLLSEGIHPSRILLTGSPMNEVILQHRQEINDSDILLRQGLEPNGYFLVSLHREDNVDRPERLTAALEGLQQLRRIYGLPVLVSTHPRTRIRLKNISPVLQEGLIFHAPFGFHDYIRLQLSSKLVLSDSGTISEESSILGFKAVTLRDFIERPEALDAGILITAGVNPDNIVSSVAYALEQEPATVPNEYAITDTSRRVTSFILGTVHSHRRRTGLLS